MFTVSLRIIGIGKPDSPLRVGGSESIELRLDMALYKNTFSEEVGFLTRKVIIFCYQRS